MSTLVSNNRICDIHLLLRIIANICWTSLWFSTSQQPPRPSQTQLKTATTKSFQNVVDLRRVDQFNERCKVFFFFVCLLALEGTATLFYLHRSPFPAALNPPIFLRAWLKCVRKGNKKKKSRNLQLLLALFGCTQPPPPQDLTH